jgi:Fibronectin type III domain
MKKNSSSKSGFINGRNLGAVLLCAVGATLAVFSFASTPSSGTVTDVSGPLTYTAGPFNAANPTPVIEVDSGPECGGLGAPGGNQAQPCDDYSLTATIPSAYLTAHPNASIKVTMSWTDTGTGNSDYDLYIYKNPRGDCSPNDCTVTDGSQMADYQSASGNNPEVANISPLPTDGLPHKYTIVIVPYTPTQEVINVRIELLPGGAGGGGGGSFGGADPTTPGVPRYQTFVAPTGSSAESSQGEFNIGFNPHTGHIFAMNIGPIWRLTPGEIQTPAKPECCEALWEDKSNVTTNTGLDPILWTDQVSGRTFVSNVTTGANAGYGYTDSFTPGLNDGDQYVPAGIAAPNGGADHETIGTGPFPAAFSSLATPANQGEIVYYCSQDVVGPAGCQRSTLDLGSSFENITPPYTGTGSPTDPCGGLHGHLHVAPDGTVWLPVNQCSGLQGGSFSTDMGTTWTEFTVPNGASQTQGADPSIAIDADSKIYYAYVRNQSGGQEGHARVAVGTLGGCTIAPVTGLRTNCSITWGPDIDLGTTHGIVNAAEIEAVGGSSGRAAVGFLGTNVPGDYQSVNFQGKWYAFIATTYDGGATWTTVNSTPNDPVQSMTGVWQQGGSAQDRNLLDFNEITVDDKGHVLYGYSDGCVTAGCIAGTAPNDFTANMRVARQSGGRPIILPLAGDPIEPALPKPPCLSGTRSATESLLTWKAPDNGGSDIVNYKIFRSNTSGNEVEIGQTGNASTTFRDIDPPTDQHLFYRVEAINGIGTGPLSNEIDLVAIPPLPVQSVCVVPGLTILSDNAGDTSAALGLVSTPAPPGSDLLSFQLAQPYQNDGIPRLVFTINTDSNPTGTESAGWSAYVAMKLVRGTNTTYQGVHMTFNATSGTTPVFESYTPSPNSSGGVDGRFVTAGSQKPAEAGSNYDGPNGKITIIVKASDLGLAPGDIINGFVSGTSQTTDVGGVGAGATTLYDQMPDSLTFASDYTVGFNSICAPMLPGVVSRKIHGPAGPFDLNLPANGNAGIECRSGGASNAYTLVYTFGVNLSAPGRASVTQGSASIGAVAVGPNLNQVTVNLSNVTNVQHLIVTLANVQDTSHTTLPSVAARMDALVGDTNADHFVDSADISQTKSVSGNAVTNANFREDLNADGFLDSADIGLVKSKSGTALPAAKSPTQPTSTKPKKPAQTGRRASQ